jgi:hypothetical protein
MNSIFGVARADFQERSRRFSFIVMMALALFAAFWFVPRSDGSLQIMNIQPDRFIQAGNPSWMPVASAWGLGFFLPLIGFFYLRSSLAFDESSGVTQLISSSPVGTVRYMLGKFCSGMMLLFCFAAVVLLGSFFMMLWHFPRQFLSAYDFLSPFLPLLFALPLCSALAVFCESTRLLRGAIGSTLYVVAYVTVLALIALGDDPGLLLRSFDLSGTSVIVRGIRYAVLEQSGEPLDTLLFLGGGFEAEWQPAAQLVFHGIPLTAAVLQGFAGMLCVALGLVVLSAPLYRITSALSGARLPRKHRKHQGNQRQGFGLSLVVTTIPVPLSHLPRSLASPSKKQVALRGVTAELRLMLSGQPLIWRIVGLVGIAVCLFAELGMVQSFILPLLMLWFINVFSGMGSREHQHGTLDSITVLPNGRLRQIISSWVAGVLIALALALPVLIRMLSVGQAYGALACVAGTVFLPSLALFLGEFTKTLRVFEVTFVVITYLVLNKVTAALYMGFSPDDASFARASIYLATGIALGIAALAKREYGRR